MATFLDRSWVTQPNTYSRFNENSGLANGLVALITVRNGIPFELISGRAFSPTGNASNRYSNRNGFPINFATTSSGTDSWNISDLPALNTTSSALTLFAFSFDRIEISYNQQLYKPVVLHSEKSQPDPHPLPRLYPMLPAISQPGIQCSLQRSALPER